MSNSLAIATVTAALRRKIELVVTPVVPGTLVTTTQPKVQSGSTPPEVNLFLYKITPNIAHRNHCLPYRNSEGTLINSAQIALNLSYLISCSGNEVTSEPQKLFSSIIGHLEEQPILSKTIIDEVVQQSFLQGSNLSTQPEWVKFTLEELSLENTLNLWAMFSQVPYQLSVPYEASVVLIDGATTPLPATQATSVSINTAAITAVADVPLFNAVSVALSNATCIDGYFNANINITKAINEDDIDYYVLYWGIDENTKLTENAKIKQLFKSGSDLVYTLPSKTVLPTEATHLLVLTKNKKGETANATSVILRELYGDRQNTIYQDRATNHYRER